MYHPISSEVKPGDTIVVWFSCGAASAIAAKKIVDVYGPTCDIRIVNNPIKEEHPDNLRFLEDVQEWLGIPIEQAAHEQLPDASAFDVWEWKQYMSGIGGAPCTKYLKKRARQKWEDANKHDWVVLGFTSEEQKRSDQFQLTERENLIPILIDLGITKQDCINMLQDAGIAIPQMYALGYPNANCIGCVKATSPTYWNHVRNTHPEVFEERAEQSRRLGVRLTRVKGKRIFLDELDPKAKGQPLKAMHIECGIFCEEEDAPTAGDNLELLLV